MSAMQIQHKHISKLQLTANYIFPVLLSINKALMNAHTDTPLSFLTLSHRQTLTHDS